MLHSIKPFRIGWSDMHLTSSLAVVNMESFDSQLEGNSERNLKGN